MRAASRNSRSRAHRRRRQRVPEQLGLPTPRTWGGRRPGAGRKRVRTRPGVPHRSREGVASRFPVHVTMRVRADKSGLRRRQRFAVVRRALTGVLGRRGFRVVEFSVMSNHVHLIVEAAGKTSLARGMQALSIRIAKGINGLLGRKGPVFEDRYHVRILRTPTEVKRALAYVLHNARRHATQAGKRLARGWVDPLSSAPWFGGYRDREPEPRERDGPPCGSPHTWLLRVGWRRRGLLAVSQVPG